LRNLKSQETYFQAAFRVQSPWSIKNPNGDEIVETKKRLSAFYPTDLDFLLRNQA
jgi:nicotinamidase-related amidase